MADDAGPDLAAAAGGATAAAAVAGATATCPWCSAALPDPTVAVCPSCDAHLIEDESVEIPGVTSVEPGLLASATAPRKVKRTFGALFIGEDNEIPLPSEAELPALAPPDADVRREMLRLELDARLTALQAEVKAMEAEEGPRPNELRPNELGAGSLPPDAAPPDAVPPGAAPLDAASSDTAPPDAAHPDRSGDPPTTPAPGA